MYKDLREFLELLEKEGELVRVKREVDPLYELAAVLRKSADEKGPAVLFEKVKGYSMPVIGELLGSRKRMALGLGSTEDRFLEEYASKEERMIPPKLVKTGPVKDVVIKGDDVDLAKLPIITHSEKDVGPYITAAVQIAKDPIKKIRNAAIHRMLLLGKNRLTLWAAADRHIGRMVLMAEERGESLEVATVVGDPLLQIASQSRLPMGADELELAGSLLGEPVELVKCETIDVEVPGRAEIVLEGRTVLGERRGDGPFGEYTGCYSGERSTPVVEVTAITMRRDAICQTCLVGVPYTETHYMWEPANAALVYREVKKLVPEIRGINMTPGGTCRHHTIVSIKKRHEAEARNVICALLAAPIGIKYCAVVDDDIDPFDELAVEWAINTRVQPDKDVIIIPWLTSSTLDPSAPASRTTAKWGVDATKPLVGSEKFERVYVPGQEKVKLEDYFGRAWRS